jgi:predicted enzyme related to lactoylglutathione lyase
MDVGKAETEGRRRAKVGRASPCLLVDDVVRTAAFYREVLGFCSADLFGEPPTFAVISRDGGDVMFQQAPASTCPVVRPNASMVPATCDVFINVDDVHALARELGDNGADVVLPVTHRPIYDGHEMIVRDCDGRLICFTQVKSSPTEQAGRT